MALLEVNNLCIAVGKVPVVSEVSFSIERGETLGIVGESGCGKSLTALAIMGLMSGTQVRITSGSINFDGRDLLAMKDKERRKIMGSGMAMIFQEPMTSLNPVYKVGEQIMEMVLQHESISKSTAKARAIELLSLVRIPDPEGRIHAYPHQMSGGMRQRVVIAMALACNPDLLIADEPTTALDVTVQAQILYLLQDLQEEVGMGMIMISHDLGVIAENCQSVAVMYRGRIVESATTQGLFGEAWHPYTNGLMASIPDVQQDVEKLAAIPGRVPTIDEVIHGCAFHPRCAKATDLCMQKQPDQQQYAERGVVCHHPEYASQPLTQNQQDKP